MRLFLVLFLTVYGGMHAYVFFKATAAFALRWWGAGLLALALLGLTVAPILVRVAETSGREALAWALAQVAFVWLGWLFLFVSASLALDGYRLLAFGAARGLGWATEAWTPSALARLLLPAALATLLAIYGVFEANQIRTERIVVETAKLPPDVPSLRIAQLSDVHLGLMVGVQRLRRILAVVEREQPDLLVSTGDLVDGTTPNGEAVAALLSAITPRLGKYAVTGNHEAYAGLKDALAFTERAGFVTLRGRAVTVAGLLDVAGVDDPAVASGGSERDLLASLPRDRFTLLLKHRPRVDPDAVGLFDLQLSGHTHDGQIFPFTVVVRLAHPTMAGRYPLSQGSELYVSRGSGTWGPPFRVGAPPEVTIVELVRKAPSAD